MGVSVRSKGKETLINSVLPKHLIGRLAAVNVAADAVDVRKNQIDGHVSLQNFQVRPPEEASLFLINMILLTLINHIVRFRDWPMVGFA